jgi:hypothetical protein
MRAQTEMQRVQASMQQKIINLEARNSALYQQNLKLQMRAAQREQTRAARSG